MNLDIKDLISIYKFYTAIVVTVFGINLVTIDIHLLPSPVKTRFLTVSSTNLTELLEHLNSHVVPIILYELTVR